MSEAARVLVPTESDAPPCGLPRRHAPRRGSPSPSRPAATRTSTPRSPEGGDPAIPVDSAAFGRAVLASLPAQIAVTDRDGVIVATNAAWDRFALENGGSCSAAFCVGADYLGTCQRAADVSEDARRAFEGISAVLDGSADRYTMEYPCHSPDRDRWFLMTVTPLHPAERPPDPPDAAAPDVSGEGEVGGEGRRPQGLVVTHLNITDRVVSERRTNDLIADLPGVVWERYRRDPAAGGESFRSDTVSRHAEELLGFGLDRWRRAAESGEDFWMARVHADDRARVRRELDHALDRRRPVTVEHRWVDREGRSVWVESHVNVIRDDRDRVIGLRGVTADATRRKRAQLALRRRAQALLKVARQLKRTNAELDQFAYVTSHDLRAPLRGIESLSGWIEDDVGAHFTPSAKKQMDLLRSRVKRMGTLISALLEYSRVGRESVRRETVDAGEVARESAELLSPPPGFEVVVAPGLPTVPAARVRLEQVFMNLIGNAVKHTRVARPHGPGRVEVTCRPAPGDPRRWEFAVSDDGPGIAPKYHEKIFVIFQTLRSRDEVEGAGLGLALVKKIVEGVGGTVSLDSDEGRGATFRFTWPRE